MCELLLMSGGFDSIALAAWRRPVLCLTVDYGQRAAHAEIRASAQVCSELRIPHKTISLPLSEIGAGLMADRQPSRHSNNEEFWPFRNQFLVTIGAMMAIQEDLETVIIGTVSSDTRHMDGSPKFISLMDEVIRHQEGAIRVKAPASELSSLSLIQESKVSHSTLAWAHSCHSGNTACGQCPGCNKHASIRAALGWEI